MRFLIIFTFLITNVLAEDLPGIKNIVIHKIPKTYDNVFFLDKKDHKININDFKGKLVILNFWATWCEPCKAEMPSLDNLQTELGLNQLKIFAINVSKEKKENLLLKDVKAKIIADMPKDDYLDWINSLLPRCFKFEDNFNYEPEEIQNIQDYTQCRGAT